MYWSFYIKSILFLKQFWFACEGLKRQWADDPEKAFQIIQVIHKKYIRAKRITVSEVIRREINDKIANKATLDAHIFDEAQKDVENLIRNSVYANFLISEVYLSYIRVIIKLSYLWKKSIVQTNVLFIYSQCKMALLIHQEAAEGKGQTRIIVSKHLLSLILKEPHFQMTGDYIMDHYLLSTKTQNFPIFLLRQTKSL